MCFFKKTQPALFIWFPGPYCISIMSSSQNCAKIWYILTIYLAGNMYLLAKDVSYINPNYIWGFCDSKSGREKGANYLMQESITFNFRGEQDLWLCHLRWKHHLLVYVTHWDICPYLVVTFIAVWNAHDTKMQASFKIKMYWFHTYLQSIDQKVPFNYIVHILSQENRSLSGSPPPSKPLVVVKCCCLCCSNWQSDFEETEAEELDLLSMFTTENT